MRWRRQCVAAALCETSAPGLLETGSDRGHDAHVQHAYKRLAHLGLAQGRRRAEQS
jgi:hypothetical protein